MARWPAFALVLLALTACPPLSAARLPATGGPHDSSGVVAAQAFSVYVDGGPKEKACDICQAVATKALIVLADPQTLQQTMAILEGVLCTQLPGGLIQKCTAMVEEYVPQALLFVLEVVNPDTMCVKTKICEPDQLLSATASTSLATLRALPRCDVCRQVAAQVLIFLENGNTQEQITAALLKACQRLRGPGLSEKCGEVVEVYVRELIALLAAVTPEEFCREAKYCPGSSRLDAPANRQLAAAGVRGSTMAAWVAQEQAVEVSGMNNPQECAACRLLVNQAKKKLKDPANQVKVTVFVTDLCSKVDKYKDQCEAAVAEYLPMFFANLDRYLDPLKLCKQAKLCSVSRAVELPAVGHFWSY